MTTEGGYIYAAIRTPRGKGKRGSLHSVKPHDLVVGLVDELRRRHPGLDPARIDDVVLGCGERARELADRYGGRFTPPTSLVDKPARGEVFE